MNRKEDKKEDKMEDSKMAKVTLLAVIGASLVLAFVAVSRLAYGVCQAITNWSETMCNVVGGGVATLLTVLVLWALREWAFGGELRKKRKS